ncbi:MAG TPA: EamA family transporter [Actinocrinis sp.]|nr:EamA family transporter [Actinocrinis sp.]
MATRTVLPRRDLTLLLLVIVTWGVNFAVLDVGLNGFPPLLFAALRFALVGSCALVVPRPKVKARWVLAVGTFTILGQYSLLYLAMAAGMPSGLASLLSQAQAMFTILFAAIALRERPGLRQLSGMAVGAGGLALVGLAIGGSVRLVALLLMLGSAATWAAGNVSTRFAKPDNGLRMVVWSSLVAPLPLLALSLTTEGVSRDAHALAHASIGSWVALAYTVGFSTLMAMTIYTMLLGKYPADRIVPFNLAIPVVGLVAGYLFMGESVTAMTMLGAAVVLVGLALVVVKPRDPRASARASTPRPDPPWTWSAIPGSCNTSGD